MKFLFSASIFLSSSSFCMRKNRIYIVDDQPMVLETAVAVVRVVMPEAEVTGFESPLKALEAIKADPPDLILSDQLMPEMDGGRLLDEARLAAPAALRVIMSGFVAQERLEAITCAHQYVAKPFDAAQLRALLRRMLAARDRVRDQRLQTTVTLLRSLPSLPQVHHHLLAELRSDRSASSVIGQFVAQDAGLSAKLLQLANSPLFGRDYLVTNPVEAVFCLGTSMVSAVVLSQSLFKHYRANAHPEFSMERVWSHCWRTAALAQAYCRERQLPRAAQDEVFLAGLLHETGRLILIDNFPDQFQQACDAAHRDGSPLGPRLREVFHAAPAEIAAYLLDLWGMPDSVVSAVSLLDNPRAAGSEAFSPAAALYIADQVASRDTPPDSFPPDEWNAAYLRSIHCPDDLDQWARQEEGRSNEE
jgi:HD-like signal output (HDOD) protein/CheY-like chemotaxis protein